MKCRQVQIPADIESLQGLFERCAAADGHFPLGEHEYLDLLAGPMELSNGLVLEDEGILVGYAHIASGEPAHSLGMAIDPLHRSAEAYTVLLEAAMDEARLIGGRALRFWVFQPAIAGILHHHGFELERELRQLRCDLPAPPPGPAPAGVTLSSFRPGRDESDWLSLNAAAFAGHPENGQWTEASLSERLRQPWFDPAGFLMAWAEQDLAGFCWTKVEDRGMGEIYVIAVDPRFQGRGLGEWLVLGGLDHLARERRCATGMLYVDAANDRALALYEKLGFWMDHVDRSFVVTL